MILSKMFGWTTNNNTLKMPGISKSVPIYTIAVCLVGADHLQLVYFKSSFLFIFQLETSNSHYTIFCNNKL